MRPIVLVKDAGRRMKKLVKCILGFSIVSAALVGQAMTTGETSSQSVRAKRLAVASSSSDLVNVQQVETPVVSPKLQESSAGTSETRMRRPRELPLARTFNARDFGAVCDGINDDALAIQAAIASASANGGTVVLPGICGVGAAGINIKSDNVVLQGQGQGAGLKVLAPGPVFSVFGPTTVQFSGCTNCHAQNLLIDGNGVSSNAIGLKETKLSGVTNTNIVNAGYLGAVVAVNNSGNSYAYNSVTRGVGVARGLWIGNAAADQMESNATVTNNQVSQMGATGIVCTCLNSRVDNNVSTHNGGSGIIFPAAGDYRASYVSATGNTVSFNKFSGFQSDAASNQTYSEFITLTNNIVEGNTSCGIYLVRARDWTVSGNQIRNNLIHGIEVGEAKRIQLNRNLVEDTRVGSDRTQNVGIHLAAQATGINDVQDVQITGNTTQNNLSNGIFLVNCSPNTMDNVTIQNNVSLSNSGYGIRASAVKNGDITNVSITNNSMESNGTGPLRIDFIDAHLSGN
jgi:parallel beta-helix repeat protein